MSNVKRSRQLDVVSALGNIDVLLGNFPRSEYEDQQADREIEADLESERLHRNAIPFGEDIKTLTKTNSSENSGVTAETKRTIKSEISDVQKIRADELGPKFKNN